MFRFPTGASRNSAQQRSAPCSNTSCTGFPARPNALAAVMMLLLLGCSTSEEPSVGAEGRGGELQSPGSSGAIIIKPFEGALEDYLQWRVAGQQLQTDSAEPVLGLVESMRREFEASDLDSAIASVRAAVLSRVRSAGDLRSVFWADRFALGVQRQLDDFELDPIPQEELKLASSVSEVTDTIVIYVNGLNTSHLAAVMDSQALRSLLSGEASADRVPGVKSVMFWNRSAVEPFYCPVLFDEPILADACTDLVNHVDPSSPTLTVLSSLLNIPPGVLHDDLLEAAEQWIFDFENLTGDVTGQVGDLVGWIKTAIARGKRVILLPHSQGNFLVDQAIRSIRAEEDQLLSLNLPLPGSDPCVRPWSPFMGVISTGAPIDLRDLPLLAVSLVQVRGDLLEQWLFGSPDGNTDPYDPAASARELHNFVGSYMRGQARANIASSVRDFHSRLPVPGQLQNLTISLKVSAGSEEALRYTCNDWSDPLVADTEHEHASVSAEVQRDGRGIKLSLHGDLSGTPDYFRPVAASYSLTFSVAVELDPGQSLFLSSSGSEHQKQAVFKLSYLGNGPAGDEGQAVDFGETALVPAETAGDLAQLLPGVGVDQMRFVPRRREILVAGEFVPVIPNNMAEVATQLSIDLEVE